MSATSNIIHRLYYNNKIEFRANPIQFHMVEDGKLIILGAYSANSQPDGLYLDCEPNTTETEWIYPVQTGNVLSIEQVYSATQTGNVLEVE